MKNSIYVIKKNWDGPTIINVVKYKCLDISSSEVMYRNIVNQLQNDHNRKYTTEVSLIEDSAVRSKQLFKPIKEIIKIENQPIIKRKELWNNVKK